MVYCVVIRPYKISFLLLFISLVIYSDLKANATIQSAYDATIGVSQEVMAGRQLYVYRAYKDMHIFHFSVPPLTSNVTFTFTANDTYACSPRNVSMYITQGSCPVVAVNGEAFPPNLWVERGVRVYPVQLTTDSSPVSQTIISPVPGDWFMAGAVTEDSNRITQAGLVPSCQSWVHIEAVYHQDMVVTNVMPSVVGDETQPPTLADIVSDTYYRFYVGPYGFTASVTISNCSVVETSEEDTDEDSGEAVGCPLVVELTPLALSHHSSNLSLVVNCSKATNEGETLTRCRGDQVAANSSSSEICSEQNNATALLKNYDDILDGYNTSDGFNSSAALNGNTTFEDQVFTASKEFNEESHTFGEDSCVVSGVVMEDVWHYVRIVPLVSRVKFQLSVSLTLCGRCQGKRNEGTRKKENAASIGKLSQTETVTHYTSSGNGSADTVNDNFTISTDLNLIANDSVGMMKTGDDEMTGNMDVNDTSFIFDPVTNEIKPASMKVQVDELFKLRNSSLNSIGEDEIDYNYVDSGLLEKFTVLNETTILVNDSSIPSNDTKSAQKKADPASSGCWNRHDLVRKSFSDNLVFEYDLSPSSNGSVPLMVNVSTATPSLLAFSLTPFLDLGGTLTVELALYPFLNTSVHQYRLSGCLSSGLRALPRHNAPCERGYTLHLNTSSSSGRGGSLVNVAQSVLVPYPDPGPWYLSITAACYIHRNATSDNSTLANSASQPGDDASNTTYTNNTACKDSSADNSTSYNCPSATVTKKPRDWRSLVTEVPCTEREVTAIFSVSSSPCVQGKCGKYGSCYQYVYSGFIFSTCVCDAGYKGWTCSDGSDATPDSLLLLATLLLTLSNLAFLPAVGLALYRRHYTEALVYTFTMCFSTLYHACDQEAYSWCIMKASVLQFCDFYSAILAFWVTLIAMAEVPFTLYSLLHMAGAVMVALGVEYDRTGLWVFVVPAVSAFTVMAISWALHSRGKHACYPPKRYWLCCLLPGTLLAATGLICYAFLETIDNYQYVHSAWHVIMALSILCILPPRRSTPLTFPSPHPDPPSSSACRREGEPALLLLQPFAGGKLLVSDGSDSGGCAGEDGLNGTIVL